MEYNRKELKIVEHDFNSIVSDFLKWQPVAAAV